jgi:hypothetical protein
MSKTYTKHKRVYFGFIFFLISLFSASVLFATNITLSWTPPTTNADGTPLRDLAGYRVYYGLISGNYTQSNDAGNVTSYTITDLSAGSSYYFAITAYDTSGNQSIASNEISTTITAISYYCDKDNDGYISSSTDGTCTGTGCQPAGCQTTAGNDCNDNNAIINPGAPDTICNGTDDNCNGQVDEGFVPSTTICGVGACSSTGTQQCTSGQLINTCNPYTPTAEVCDGSDNNCNGQVDEGCTSAISVSKVLLSEDFSGGIPNTWEKAGNWNTDNPCEKTISSPFVAPFAIADSSCTMTGTDELITPVLDTTSCNSVELAFSNQRHLINGNVEINISDDGGSNWTNTVNMPLRDGYPDPNWKTIDISDAADTDNAKIRFSYTGNSTNEFWALDNVWVTCQPTQLEFSSTIMEPSSKQTILISNTGVQELSINAISVIGADAGSFTLNTNSCTNQTLQPAESCMLDIVFQPAAEGSKSADLLINSNDPNTPAFTIPLTGPGTDIINPAPEIKVNGSDDFIKLRKGKTAEIELQLNPESYEGIDAEWWVLLERKNNWYYYDTLSERWRLGILQYDQKPLVNTVSVETLKMKGLPKGLYNLYFGVDTNKNGSIDPETYYYDVMSVKIKK